MIILILSSVIGGILVGKFIIAPDLASNLSQMTTYFLAILLFGIGIDIGKNKDEVLSKIKQLGWKVISVPIVVAIGSIIGAVISGTFLTLPFNEASAIGAGFGWYSLSGVLITKIYDIQIGSLAFLTNVFRELLAVILIPLLAKTKGKITLIAPGGATTMDTTLPLIIQSSSSEIGVIAFINGIVLSSLVPILVPFLIKL
ncbi:MULTISPECIES: lysine exporter LysO family protein [unclassified Candidatus Frackibacter]|uniref:lysine exporter LysO family protein n=1 Tax=unclassified Candidatus Frackibacter TaxID=2648818 RepID=UPI0007935B2A|nr:MULTISPECIES: lysine exporter LysO family protein [unclassified Candidatus Frackibacter]KXS40076.1 MAG: hypothetical protein AWU54_2107 [Candidatus Frackibacter sp. T328-2]SDC35350.1 Membrane protein of unknown function [Candidatus Frackibacter sp. WG11]SEM56063.1 Membrane protein of unknown function [Candidatus Frackibacter sp. WG12]SFL71227.1 Membrane protein of unknown function [Candidatus Frackibacter sp. WG13]